MKKFLFITMLMIGFVGTGSSLLASCPGIGVGGLCCVGMGTSEMQCTDGQCYYCVGSCVPVINLCE